jgi:hypothetical protein
MCCKEGISILTTKQSSGGAKTAATQRNHFLRLWLRTACRRYLKANGAGERRQKAARAAPEQEAATN